MTAPRWRPGEWWRLLSAHFVHLDAAHAVLNGLGAGADVGAVRPRLFAAALAGYLSVLVADHQRGPVVLRIRKSSGTSGASGALHGVMTAGTLAHLRRRDLDGWILAVFIIVETVLRAVRRFDAVLRVPPTPSSMRICTARSAASCWRCFLRSRRDAPSSLRRVVILRAHVEQLTRIRISRTGLPVGRHAGQARRPNRRRARHLRRSIESARLRPLAAVPAGSGGRSQHHRTHPARHAGGRASPPGACGVERGGADAAPIVTGHSLGEFTALVAADAIDFATCVDLVRFRGKAMQEAVPAGTGAMAALLGLEDADVEAACARGCAEGRRGRGRELQFAGAGGHRRREGRGTARHRERRRRAAPSARSNCRSACLRTAA